MADKTKIEWTDATWNPVTGCSVVSPGCTNCYAMKVAHRFRAQEGSPYFELTHADKAVWDGSVHFNERALTLPLRWKRPRRIFVNSMGDLFHDTVPDAWIDRVFAVMALAPQHSFQLLTKRPERMKAYVTAVARDGRWLPAADDRAMWVGTGGRRTFPLPNVWLGVSAEDQRRADERIPLLLATPAAMRFVSCEPLLGPIDLHRLEIISDGRGFHASALQRQHDDCFFQSPALLDWVIAGGESGKDARPMHPNWVRSLRDQCAGADSPVPFFFKQWGEWHGGSWDDNADTVGFLPNDRACARDLGNHAYWQSRVHWFDEAAAPDGPGAIRIGKKAAGALLDGVEHKAFPA